MTIPCANCGVPLADDAYRCPSCDALAPLPDDDVFDSTEALPWAIPIRDSPIQDDRERAELGDAFRPVTLGVLIVAMLAGVVVLASGVLGGGDDGDDDPSVTEVAGQTADADVESDSITSTTADDAATTTTSTTSSSTTSTTTTSTTSTTTPTTTTTAAPSPGSVTQLSSSFEGGWVAQLTSVPTSAGSDAVENAWSKARSYASGAVVTRSDDWSSMEPGYWVVVDAGPFESADEARAFCASVEHGEEADCLPRELRGRRN
jgi:cell division septation protein DedD